MCSLHVSENICSKFEKNLSDISTTPALPLKPDRFNVVVKLHLFNGMGLTSVHVDAHASTDPVDSISTKEAEPIDVIKLSGSPWTHQVSCTQIKSGLRFSVTSESSLILLKRLRAFRERNVYCGGWEEIWEGGGRVGCALGPLTGVIAQGWDYLALIFFFFFFFFFFFLPVYILQGWPDSSLEPGPSRARYFPRDMLLLTTTARERAWRLLKISSSLIG